jgi:hypothetical protein
MGTWIAPEATSGTASRNAAGIFGSMSEWFMKKPFAMMRFTISSNGLIVTGPPAMYVDDEGATRGERTRDQCAALARNAVDGEPHAIFADGCSDLIDRVVFVHDH